jgi:hypothetical protein
MGGRRIAAIALSGALVAGGTGVAIAAVTKDDERKAEQAVLDDAAKRLGVTPDKLRDALSAAQDAQLDQAVKDGKLTRKQADAIKERREQSGSVLGGPRIGKRFHPGGPHLRFRGGHGAGGPKGAMIGDVASALGLSTDKLFEQLRDGKSIADIAKAQGKTLADVRSAVTAKAKTRLDKAVKDGDITQTQADDVLEQLDDRLADLGTRRGLLPRRHRHLRGDRPPMPELRRGDRPPMPELRPGGLELPGDVPPQPVPVPGVFM